MTSQGRAYILAREQGKSFDILLVRFALERLLLHLSNSRYRERFILKGGKLVTQWFNHDNRETRDIDFLGFGSDDPGEVETVSSSIIAIDAEDYLVFDTLTLSAIRSAQTYCLIYAANVLIFS